MPITSGAQPGRTLQYRRRYCDQLVAFMARGYSLTAFAGEIGTSHANVLRWCEEHTLFAKALECGQARRVRLLEERLLAADGRTALEVQMQALKATVLEERPASRTRPTTRRTTRLQAPKLEGVSFEAPDNGRE